MPPVEETQPSDEDRHAAIVELEGKLVAHAAASASRQPAMLRRLNRAEYRNTIRDLLHLHFGSFDPTSEFPDDNRVQGFASVGEELVTSSFLLRQYLEAADQIVERAVHFESQPEIQRWDFLPPFDRTTGGFIIGENGFYRQVLKEPPPYQSLYERMRGLPKDGYHPVDEMRGGVPVGGWYTIRIQAEAKFRYANLDPTKSRFPFLWESSQPLRLALSTCTLGWDRRRQQADAKLRVHAFSSRAAANWLRGISPTISSFGWSAAPGWKREIFHASVFPTAPPTVTTACSVIFSITKSTC